MMREHRLVTDGQTDRHMITPYSVAMFGPIYCPNWSVQPNSNLQLIDTEAL